MAQKGNKCLSVFLVASMVVMLFVAIVVPIIVRQKVSTDVANNGALVLETANTWGQVPGNRSIQNTKTFILYNLTSDVDDVFNGTMNFQEVVLAPYTVNFTYEDLAYAPNTNESIQYYKVFEHTYQGNENLLQNLPIRTLSLGGMKAAYLMSHLKPSQIFVMTLSRILGAFNNDILPTILTKAAFDLYLNDQQTVFSTIFLYNNTISQDTATALWNDPDYGWSTVSTLKTWFWLTMTYYYSTEKNNFVIPANDTVAIELMNRFDLTINQLNALAGGTSMLSNLAQAVQAHFSQALGCQSTGYCTLSEYFTFQWTSAALTLTPFPGSAPVSSVKGWNATFPVGPECVAANNTVSSLFDSATIQNFFTQGSAQSLFSFRNVDALLAQPSNLDLINATFQLGTSDQINFLIQYADYILNNFTYFNDFNSDTQALKGATDLTAYTLVGLFEDLGDILAYNVTAIGTYNATVAAALTCSDIVGNYTITTDLVDSICNNPDLTLDSIEGQSIWIQALLEGPGSDSWNFIETTIEASDDQLEAILDPTSQFGNLIQTVLQSISQAVGCSGTVCRPSELTALQWSQSAVLGNLPSEYFFDSAVTSLVDLYPEYFNCVIPEFTEYTTRVLDEPQEYPEEAAAAFASYGEGSILNKFELFYFSYFMYQNHFASAADHFNISTNTAIALYNYTNYIYVNGYLSPESCGYSLVKNAYDLLWGWEDPIVSSLANDNVFEGGQPYDTFVSLAGYKDNIETYQKLQPNLLNSGASNISLIRQLTAYQGNTTLAVTRDLNDGVNNYTEYFFPWGFGTQSINGTDSMGFSPYLTSSQPLSVFEPDFMRNLNYLMQSNNKFGEDSYDIYNYTMDPYMMAVNPGYLVDLQGYINMSVIQDLPLVASYPYYLNCDGSSYQQVTINGTGPSAYQGSIAPGYFLVEKLTGVTLNYTKNYQYSLYYKNPFYPQLGRFIVPLITVQETYLTSVDQLNDDLGDYYHSYEVAYFVQIAGFIVAGLLFWAWLFYFIIVRKKGQNSDDNNRSHEHGRTSLKRGERKSEYNSKLVHSNMIQEVNEDEENDAPYHKMTAKEIK